MSRLPAKSADSAVDDGRASRNTVAVSILRIGARQDILFRDRFQKPKPEDGRCEARVQLCGGCEWTVSLALNPEDGLAEAHDLTPREHDGSFHVAYADLSFRLVTINGIVLQLAAIDRVGWRQSQEER